MIAYESLNVNAVTSHFDVSRTAIYKHIKVLTECGLIVILPQGRERFCEARLDKLSEVSDWVQQYRQIWTARFDSLDSYLEKLQAKNKTQTKTKRHAKKK
jgi:DNA-binding transcriptional ArsR family regulator